MSVTQGVTYTYVLKAVNEKGYESSTVSAKVKVGVGLTVTPTPTPTVITSYSIHYTKLYEFSSSIMVLRTRA